MFLNAIQNKMKGKTKVMKIMSEKKSRQLM